MPPILPPDTASLARAAEALRAGGLIGLPTETVYGLAADATNGRAVAAVFAAKGRPRFNPLISHVTDMQAAARHAVFSPLAERLAAAFWPGPLTLVLPARADAAIHPLARAGLATVALRAPAHPTAQAVLAAVGRPLAAPSANRSGHVSPTTAAHVAAEFGAEVALTLDGGPARVGLESTVIAAEGARAILLRPGGLAREAVEAIAGPLLAPDAAAAPASPGMLLRHYAPATPLRLEALGARPGETLIGFGPVAGARTLSATGDLVEAAANLFAMLRAADEEGAAAIAVAPIPHTGLGEAINDRLARAAAGR